MYYGENTSASTCPTSISQYQFATDGDGEFEIPLNGTTDGECTYIVAYVSDNNQADNPIIWKEFTEDYL